MPITQRGRKIIQPNLVTFLKIYRNLLKSKSLSVDPLLLPWQHFFAGALREDRVLQNSNDITLTSFLDQSLQKFVILLEMLRCISVPNLSKIRLLMFPWQHIFELALMQNQPIQLSNDVTVTLFLNQSSQNFELCFEIIICTSVQNYSRIKCFILPWQHIL